RLYSVRHLERSAPLPHRPARRRRAGAVRVGGADVLVRLADHHVAVVARLVLAGGAWRAAGEPPMDDGQYDPHYLEGIKFFNECEFFESHEAWEEVWTEHLGPSRKFYQGLIQAAVALHHFGNGNIRGAKKLYYGSRGY